MMGMHCPSFTSTTEPLFIFTSPGTNMYSTESSCNRCLGKEIHS